MAPTAPTARLQADLTIEVAEIVADPQIEGWSGTVRDRTGVQIGEGNEAEDTVQVNVLKWASAVLELERELLAEAVRPGIHRRGTR